MKAIVYLIVAGALATMFGLFLSYSIGTPFGIVPLAPMAGYFIIGGILAIGVGIGILVL